MIDIAVVGAGLSGLLCAQRLQRSGYRVVVVEKSRGLGGRMATRRLANTCADHGVAYLEDQGEYSRQLIQALPQTLIQPWTKFYRLDRQGSFHPDPGRTSVAEQYCHPRYVVPDGMTTIAKFLASGLEVRHNQRVTSLLPTENFWTLAIESTGETLELKARAIVLAIPAPQALALIEPLADQGFDTEFLASLRSVEFDPCLTAIALYAIDRASVAKQYWEVPWQAVTCSEGDVVWVGRDSSKRESQPLYVVRSSAAFAQQHLETSDLQAIGRELLQAAKNLLPLGDPVTLQVHRWRYAFVRRPLAQTHLTTNAPLLLSCCGDWCGGSQVETALRSGAVTGERVNQELDDRAMPKLNFADLV